MSSQISYPFTTPSNYTYDSDKIEIISGSAKLKRDENPNQTFNEDFADNTNFTYDSDYSEFTGGLIQQIDRKGDCTISASYYVDIDADWGEGVLTGTAFGGADVDLIDGDYYLDCNQGDVRYVDYAGLNNADGLVTTGCIRFIMRPMYSGAPATHQIFFHVGKGTTDNNQITLWHHTNGNGHITIRDSSGVTMLDVDMGIFTPVSGTDYEVEVNFDTVSNECRAFVDGVQFGTTQTIGAGTRTSDIDEIRVGSNRTAIYTSNFYIKRFKIFSEVQHTADYTPEGLEDTIYKYRGDVITLPTMTYSGFGSIIAYTSFATTDTNSPRYILNGTYWNGSVWTTSDNSWSQASPEADVLANISTLTLSDTIIVKLVFQNSFDTQMSCDDLTITYTGQLSSYVTNGPSIVFNTTFAAEYLSKFKMLSFISGSDQIKFQLGKDSKYYYHDGSDWVLSDGTYSQSNTITQVQQYLSTFIDATASPTITIKAFLHSADGTTTPTLDEVNITYYGATDTFYIDDEDIGSELFNGEEVYGENTINYIRNRKLKEKSYNKVQSIIRKTTLQTDSYGDLAELQMLFYNQLLNGERMRFIKSAEKNRKWYQIKYGSGPPLYMHDPTNHTKNT